MPSVSAIKFEEERIFWNGLWNYT